MCSKTILDDLFTSDITDFKNFGSFFNEPIQFWR
ncbi:Uncharacterised protein [Segatella copri]|nr:Uncharacterised protein [Segatella copri]